jgi:hypothetical protein
MEKTERDIIVYNPQITNGCIQHVEKEAVPPLVALSQTRIFTAELVSGVHIPHVPSIL